MNQRAPVVLLALLALGCVHREVDCATEPENRFCDRPRDAAVNDGDAVVDGGDRDDAGPCGAPCTGSTPHCDEGLSRCVACRDDDDCDAAAPHCDRSGADPLCIECLASDECADAETPACIAGTCAPCAADEQCAAHAATPDCDEASGRCVACTRETEATRCGAFSCSSLTHTCTTTTRGNQDTCDPCEADSECAIGRRCVQHTFMGTDVGYFCFLDSSMGGCGDTDTARRPYSTRTELTSIDGATATYCMPPTTTTCEGIRDTRSVSCTMDSECGVDGLDDGYCPLVGTGALACSYRCGGAFDCRDPLTCGGTPGHCRP